MGGLWGEGAIFFIMCVLFRDVGLFLPVNST
jgi:hypothetical protein